MAERITDCEVLGYAKIIALYACNSRDWMLVYEGTGACSVDQLTWCGVVDSSCLVCEELDELSLSAVSSGYIIIIAVID